MIKEVGTGESWQLLGSGAVFAAGDGGRGPGNSAFDSGPPIPDLPNAAPEEGRFSVFVIPKLLCGTVWFHFPEICHCQEEGVCIPRSLCGGTLPRQWNPALVIESF